MNEEDLQNRAANIRKIYLKKPLGTSNVAVAEVYLSNGLSFGTGATSKGGYKSPIPQPQPKSNGGYFEPSIDSQTGRLMNTDAEYKVLSEIAATLEMSHNCYTKGDLYLYTEFQPCESCTSILNQFREKFPHITVKTLWNLPYPRES